MNAQRYDIEWVMAGIVVAYLTNKIDVALQEKSPVVTFFDPMAIEEDNRFVVEVPAAQTNQESPGNYEGSCKCTVKSRVTEATGAEDQKAHFNRTNWMRDVLMSSALLDDLNALATAGEFVLDYIQPHRDFSTDATKEGWIYSDIAFRFTGYFPA